MVFTMYQRLILTFLCKINKTIEFSRYRNGEKVPVHNTSHYEGGTTDQHSLIILDANGEDMGNYTCVLGNAVGNGTSDESIDVNVLCKFNFFITTIIICYDFFFL